MNKEKGISLISLIITIIVIIILAAIVIFTGLSTPDRANLAKFTSEFADFQTAVDQDYYQRYQKHATSNETRSKAQIYLEIASNGEYNEMAIDTSDYAMDEPDFAALNGRIKPEGLRGTEYYEITHDTNVEKWTKEVKYFEQTEKHYVTDEGEVFTLPGYLVEENGTSKWYVNANKYYEGEKQPGGEVAVVDPTNPGEDTPGGGTENPPSGGEGTMTGTELTDALKGKPVRYNIPYTDANTGTAYDQDTGWKLLDYEYKSESKSYDIKIISTGLPAMIYYSGTSEQDWLKSDTEVTATGISEYTDHPTYFNRRAAAALYDLGSMTFKNGTASSTNKHYAYYTAINGNTEGEKTGAKMFTASGLTIDSIRSLTKAEAEEKYSAFRNISAEYWLASPYSYYTDILYNVDSGGGVLDSYDLTLGVRPVVSISGVQIGGTNELITISQ